MVDIQYDETRGRYTQYKYYKEQLGGKMKYSRSQCARTFGVTMDTLRYYETIGLVKADKEDHRCIYGEQEIMKIMELRKMKSLGFDNDALLNYFGVKNNYTQKEIYEDAIDSLHDKINILSEKIEYLESLEDIFYDVSEKINVIQIGPLPERELLLYDKEHEKIICHGMEGLPYLNYGYWIDRNTLHKKKMDMRFAVDIAPLKRYHPDLYEELKKCGHIISNGSGMKVYCYRFFKYISDLTWEDFKPLIQYAQKHRFQISGDVFGGILGPECINEEKIKGYILSLTMEVKEKEDTDLE